VYIAFVAMALTHFPDRIADGFRLDVRPTDGSSAA
jgi:hypothetical protein